MAYNNNENENHFFSILLFEFNSNQLVDQLKCICRIHLIQDKT